MALDINGADVAANTWVRIGRDRLYYGGTVAFVIEAHPFHALTVEMFNGKQFRISSRDVTALPNYPRN